MKITKCRICSNGNLHNFLSLGNQPLANSFLKKEQLDEKEEKFPLNLCFCDNCKLVMLTDVISPEKMFKNYVYVSSTTNTFKEHFKEFAHEFLTMMNLDNNSLIVDIGSNDGILLKPFKDAGMYVIGVEPATNVAKIAESSGIETINEFFNDTVTQRIINKKGRADMVTATNVFAHVDDITSLTRNVYSLLKDDGIFVIEVQYIADMLRKMTFDNVYHEHLSYFSGISLINFFSKFDMEIFKFKKVDSHGGSLRVYVKKKKSERFPVDNSVKQLIDEESELGIRSLATYVEFAKKVDDVRNQLLNFVQDIKSQGKNIAAYGAPAKGNTLLNFCGIDNNYISFVVDDNPLKQGLFTPGTKIPVFDSTKLDEQKPDYVLILAWNFANEILTKNQKYRDHGMKFIIPLPKPSIV